MGWRDLQLETRGPSHLNSNGEWPFCKFLYRRASDFRNIQYMDISGKFIDAEGEGLAPYVTNPSCYDLAVQNNNNDGYGTNFYFGGPGYSQKCP